jgi:hypothetical protein
MIINRINSKLAVLLVILMRNICSLIALFWNLKRSFYYHPWGRLVSNSFNGSFVILSVMNYTAYPTESKIFTEYLLIPILLLASVVFKLALNLDRNSLLTEGDYQTYNLTAVLRLAQGCTEAFNRGESVDTSPSSKIRACQLAASLIKNEKKEKARRLLRRRWSSTLRTES